MSDILNIAVIGCGYWGQKLVHNFITSENWILKYACDLDMRSLKAIKSQYPNVETVDNDKKLFHDPKLDAIAIATPVNTHFELSRKSLEAGKHTWVEKPLTAKSWESEKLVELAERKNLLLHVDHTYIYTPAIRKIKTLYDSNELGELYYFDSVRINLGLFQHDINVIWDLAPHDISILHYVVSKKPKSVNATGRCNIDYNGKKLENIAYIVVDFEDGSIAHFHVNWLSPVKVRQILMGCSKKMLIFNDMESIEKIKIYDSGVEINNTDDIYDALIQYRTGDMYSPKVENRQALQLECQHFYECIVGNIQTDTSGTDGLYVVQLLEAADESMRKNVPVNI